MRPSWEQKYDQQEKEFQQRQEVIGEIESRNNLNGGISRHLGLGDGRPGLEWTGAEIEYDFAQRNVFGGWPLWAWVVLAVMGIAGVLGLIFDPPGNGAAANSSGNQLNTPPAASSQQHTP